MPAGAKAFAGFFVWQDAWSEVAGRDIRNQEASQQRAGSSVGMTFEPVGLVSVEGYKPAPGKRPGGMGCEPAASKKRNSARMTGSKTSRLRSFARKRRLLRMTGCLVSRAAQNHLSLFRSAHAWLEQNGNEAAHSKVGI